MHVIDIICMIVDILLIRFSIPDVQTAYRFGAPARRYRYRELEG